LQLRQNILPPNWQKTMPQNFTAHSDMLGRSVKTVYADGSYSESAYNEYGQGQGKYGVKLEFLCFRAEKD